MSGLFLDLPYDEPDEEDLVPEKTPLDLYAEDIGPVLRRYGFIGPKFINGKYGSWKKFRKEGIKGKLTLGIYLLRSDCIYSVISHNFFRKAYDKEYAENIILDGHMEKFLDRKLALIPEIWKELEADMAGDRADYTYFIYDRGTNLMKIGKSKDPEARIRVLNTGSPVELCLLGYTSLVSEKDMHRRFKRLRRKGEWFFCDYDLREFVGKLFGGVRIFRSCS